MRRNPLSILQSNCQLSHLLGKLKFIQVLTAMHLLLVITAIKYFLKKNYS